MDHKIKLNFIYFVFNLLQMYIAQQHLLTTAYTLTYVALTL